MQITIKLILTFIIIGVLVAGILCIIKIWRSDIDVRKMLSKPFSFVEFKNTLPAPKPQFHFITLQSNYKPGLEVHGVVWKEDYVLSRFRIKNECNENKMEDVRIKFEIPGGFVSRKVSTQIGADGVSFSEDKLPIGIGSQNTINQTITWYSNRLNLGISTLKENSYVEIDFVIKRVPIRKNGHFSISYSFYEDSETKVKEYHTYPLQELEPDGRLKIDTENEIIGSYKASARMIPDNPISFKKDGSVEIKK